MKGSRRTEAPGRNNTTHSWKKTPAGRTTNRIAEQQTEQTEQAEQYSKEQMGSLRDISYLIKLLTWRENYG